MENREQIIEDTTLVTNTMKRIKVETPLGSIESDSGNHGLDILTIVGVIAVLYVGKKLVDKLVDKFFRSGK